MSFVRAAQAVGLSLEEISDALATLPDDRTPTKRDWTRLSAGCGCGCGCGCLSLRTCALHNRDDVKAARGPGAVELEPRYTSAVPATGRAPIV